jgi:hypothetical protein
MKAPARNVSSERARELSQKQSKVICNMKTPSLQDETASNQRDAALNAVGEVISHVTDPKTGARIATLKSLPGKLLAVEVVGDEARTHAPLSSTDRDGRERRAEVSIYLQSTRGRVMNAPIETKTNSGGVSGTAPPHISPDCAEAKTSVAGLTAAAGEYRDNHHFVPLQLQGKDPTIMGKGWHKRTLESPLPNFQDGDNIGFLLGEPSGWVVRIDPDFATVPWVVNILYPEATATFGRASAPCSGRLYVCEGQKSKDFRLPNSMKNDPRLPIHDGKPGLVVLQILSNGKQTMSPPSVHPVVGEAIVWESSHKPAKLSADELNRRASIEAFLMVVLRARNVWRTGYELSAAGCCSR